MGNTLSPVKNNQSNNTEASELNNISSTIPYMNKLTSNAKILKNYLQVKEVNGLDTDTPVDIKLTETENFKSYFDKNDTVQKKNVQLSDTSPFISSDIYNNLMNNKQEGGAKKSSEKLDSSESTTTSSSEKKVSHNGNLQSTSDLESINVNSDISLGSYVSSSAHTGGRSENNSSYNTTNSENDLSDSINTSDINMISVEH